MSEPENIDYKGIGDGLSITLRDDVSSNESTIDLNEDWQIVPPHGESDASESTTKPTIGIEPEIKLNADSSAFPAKEAQIRDDRYSLQNLTPLERYCYHVQTHEQLVVGQISNPRSLTQPSELDDSLIKATRLLGGSPPKPSASSWSILSSGLDGGPNMAELDHPPPVMDLCEWQSMPQEEQAEFLRRVAKLRRRLKTEGSPRQMRPVRVRKRSKGSNRSNEATGA
ncbi:hypothetical protein F5Y10DRAFT_239968 [Nemania abortiva]|nr:hypothetical protein F5Y10DRAFT_239968 [Nemania abortiva]